MAPLDPRLPVADAYYFIAHDYMVGRRRLHPNVMGIGLGAALLGELVFTGNLDVRGGIVYVIGWHPPGDALLHEVLAHMIDQPQHRDLPTWLAFLSVTALGRVSGRLRTSHMLTEVERRRIIGTRRVLVPSDVNYASWQAIRLERLLNTSVRMGQADCFLAGLVSATGLMPHVLWDPDTSHVGYDVLPHAIAALVPQLSAIVRQAESAVGQSVLVPR
jgi:hypothetical protein